jgi:putative GTP pyrophosphokinase
MIPPQMAVTIEDAREFARVFGNLRMSYRAAIKEISTKLEVLDNEYSFRYDHNPIHHMQCRVKSLDSVMEQIERKGFPKEVESLYKITDFAGVRVVCNYLDDVYTVEQSLLRQDDIKLIRRKDYISEPKESGYRSLHLVVEVPIFLSDSTYHMPVEIQIRTIAMDTWASLEHELKYKQKSELSEEVMEELKSCARSMVESDNYSLPQISSPMRTVPTSCSGLPAMSAVCQPSASTASTARSTASASAASWKE